MFFNKIKQDKLYRITTKTFDFYVDARTKDFYHEAKNRFVTYDKVKFKKDVITFYFGKEKISYKVYSCSEITIDEYFTDLAKMFECNCIAGDGYFPDIRVSKTYDIEQEFKKIYPELSIEPHMYRIIQFRISYDEYSIYMPHQIFVKRGCLTCGACIDGYKKMIKYFNEHVKKLQKQIEDGYKLKKICGE